MELQILLESEECTSCDLLLTDVTPLNNFGYLNEDYIGFVPGRFKYSETIGLGVLKQNTVISSPTNIKSGFNYHEVSDERIIKMSSPLDAWYSVSYIVMPSNNWFYRQLQILTGEITGILELNSYQIVYFTDGKVFYKAVRIPNTLTYSVEIVTIDYLLTCNISETTLSKTTIDYVSICMLTRCFLNISKKILESKNFSKCFEKSSNETADLYTRDLIWMALNAIKFAVQFDQLTEAQRIIEQIGGCNGICEPVGSTSGYGTQDCGCS